MCVHVCLRQHSLRLCSQPETGALAWSNQTAPLVFQLLQVGDSHVAPGADVFLFVFYRGHAGGGTEEGGGTCAQQGEGEHVLCVVLTQG